jgi:hypothetical protein
MQNLFLISRKHDLQFRLFQNQNKLLNATNNPLSMQEAFQLDTQVALENESIRTELAIIEAQQKSTGKNLDTFA